jgi:PAS domain S-box-containing protein
VTTGNRLPGLARAAVRHDEAASLDFLSGGGEMGALMRAHDWSHSSLGRPTTWPQPLRTAVRLLLNTGHPMYIWWGADLACLYNDAYRQSIGPERHPGSLGMPGRQVWDEIWDIIGPQIEQVMAGRGATWHVDHLVPITRNGRREDVYWTYSYSPIDDSNAPNGVGGVLVICTETTEKVLAEKRLAEQVERQRRLFEQAPGFIAVLRGPDHVFEFVNEAYRRLAGDRSFIGRSAREVLPDVEGQGFFELLDTVYATGERFVARQTPLSLKPRPDAAPEERFLDFIYEPVIDAVGEITGIFVEGHDVTEQKHAEAALRESEERFRIAQELSLDAFTILQAVRDENGRIVDFEWLYANPTAAEIIRRPADYLVGRRLLDVLPGNQTASDLFSRYVRLVETGEPYDIELRYEADGITGWFRNMAVRLDERIAVYFSDITERKQSEEKLKLLMREVDHRARNMLALVQALIRMTRAESVPEFKAALRGRIEALGRVQTMLTDSRWRGADLEQLISDELAPYQSDGRIQLAGPPATLPPAAAQAIAMAVHELTTNAVKYGALSAPGGRLRIEWQICDGLLLRWTESGGPASALPDSRGFGTTVIENSVQQQLGGSTRFDWGPSGLAVEMSIPAQELTVSGGSSPLPYES